MLKCFLRKHLKPTTEIIPPAAPAEPERRGRKGATAMEYLVALSFILILLILAAQQLGAVTGGLLGNAAKVTNSSNSTGP